jgi:hypothetical protein
VQLLKQQTGEESLLFIQFVFFFLEKCIFMIPLKSNPVGFQYPVLDLGMDM